MNWNVTPKEAVKIQEKLRGEIKIQPLSREVKLIGGADISLNMFEKTAYVGIIVLTYPALVPVSQSLAISKVNFPYIPGLLSFREIPPLLTAWEKLAIKPDVLVLDGQGIMHPRRMGIATHFGLTTNTPTIGSAKSPLIKVPTPLNLPGSVAQIHHANELVGYAIRTKRNSNPIYVSPGHLIDFQNTLEIITNCVKNYRLPEPTRLAHNLVNTLRRREVAI